jgi:hypothetical protein
MTDIITPKPFHDLRVLCTIAMLQGGRKEVAMTPNTSVISLLLLASARAW